MAWVLRPAGILALLLGCGACCGAAAVPGLPDASAYLVKAGDSILWERSADQRLAPASLTKIMTALLVLEHYVPDASIAIGTAATAETGSRIGLLRGDAMSEQDLLAAALIQSANDACHALADHVAGNEARFVAMMNERAQAWALHNTHFANACGHDHASHYSSARDLALLGELAMAQPAIAALVAREGMDIASARGHVYHLVNKNALIGRYPGAIGVKTGFTARAGKCLVAVAVRGGRRVLVVLLNAHDRWWAASDVLDRAFAAIVHAR